jgi:hypothetical protein
MKATLSALTAGCDNIRVSFGSMANERAEKMLNKAKQNKKVFIGGKLIIRDILI